MNTKSINVIEQNQRVVLVTVTYNSSDYFERLIKAADEQTYKLAKIIVVDNNSTEEHFSKIQHLCNERPLIEIVRSDRNLGGAGGFQMGMEYVCRHYPDIDWIWIMDDDAFPTPNCLENLIRWRDLEGAGCLTPLIYGTELKKYQLYHHKIVSKYLNKDIAALRNIDDFNDFLIIEANAFVGPLFKMEIVKKIGVPDGSLFIYGDDLEYVYRTSRVSKVYLVKDAVINHRDTISNTNEVNPDSFWKEYYRYRNRFLFINKYKKNKIAGMIGKLLVIRSIIKVMLSTLIKSEFRIYRRIKLECEMKALLHGLRNMSGKTIDPQKFRERIEKTG